MRAWDRERSKHYLPIVASTRLAIIVIIAATTSNAFADAFTSYQKETHDIALPAGTSVYDVQPDGRLAALSGLTLYTETAVGSGQFAVHGTLPTANISLGAAFMRFSPDGSRFAVGNNGSGGTPLVGVFNADTLSGTWHSLDHYDAEWFNNNSLAINAGDLESSRISLFDINGLTNTTIIDGIEGGSGGVTFDAQGRIFTGNGYANGSGSTTGEIRAFELSDWQTALSGTPLDFENTGVVVGDVLSAGSLGFDVEGNLHVAGGDFSQPDYGYAGLVSATAIENAIDGGGPLDPTADTDLLCIDPDPASSLNFYTIAASPIAAELYVKDYGVDTLYVYSIPEPTVALLMPIGLGILVRGHRRRHSSPVSCTARTRR